MKYPVIVLALGLSFASQGFAATVLYDEAIDGDLGDTYFTPTTDLGVLTSGPNSVFGQVRSGDYDDTFTFTIAEGYQLSSLRIADYFNTSTENYWSGFCISSAPYPGTCIEYINGAADNIGLDLLQFDSAPGPQGPGDYFVGVSWVSTGSNLDYVDYELQLEVAPVPLPAASWLFVSGLAGVFGMMRRRQTAS